VGSVKRRHLTAAELRSQARDALAVIEQMKSGAIGEPLGGSATLKIDEHCAHPAHQLGWAIGTLQRIADGRTFEARMADEHTADLAKAVA
jgi:hypothetical protein